MAKFELIRKNLLTNQYEHWHQITNDDGSVSGYWAPGLSGLDWINNQDIVIDQIKRGEILLPVRSSMPEYSYILSYEEYSDKVHGDFLKEIENAVLTWTDFIENYDIGIRELQSNKTPIILGQLISNRIIDSFSENNTLKVLSGYNTVFQINAINPIYDLDYQLQYRWLKDGEVVSEERSIIISSENDTGEWQAEVENEAGITKSEKIKVKIFEPQKTKKFYVNLIKSGDGQDGLGAWTVIKGNPEVHKIGNWANQPSDMYYNEAWYNRTWLGSYGERTEPFGPVPSAILEGNPSELNNACFYIRGGLAGSENDVYLENFVVMKQDIDLSSVSEFIDCKIYGVEGVYGCLFGWLGNMGQATGLVQRHEIQGNNVVQVVRPSYAYGVNAIPNTEMSWNSLSLIYDNGGWQNIFDGNLMVLDKVYVEVKLFNENDNEIKSEYRMYSPLHMGEDFKFFLRCQHIYIPIGTRRIEIWVKFQRGQNAILHPFRKDVNGRSMSRFVRIGRWNSNINKVEQVHTAAFTHLNLHLYINDTDEYFDKIKNFTESIYFKQYEMIPDLLSNITPSDIPDSYMDISGQYERLPVHAKFIENRFRHSDSAIHLKVKDLITYKDIISFEEIYNLLTKQLSWYIKRFKPCQIWNAIIDAVTEYSLPIDLSGINKKPCVEIYDKTPHYPVWHDQTSVITN